MSLRVVSEASQQGGGPQRSRCSLLLLGLALCLQEAAAGFNPGDWAQWGKDEVGHLAGEATNLTGRMANGIAPTLATAGNVTSNALGAVAGASKHAAVAALLWSTGHCVDYHGHIADAQGALGEELADALQDATMEPSKNTHACMRAVGEGMDSLVQRRMANFSAQEQLAAKWVARDRAEKICNKHLMEMLKIMAPIRTSYPEQYKAAVKDRLFLRVLTRETLKAELKDFCGEAEETSQLFLVDGRWQAAGSSAGPSLRALGGLACVAGLFVLGVVTYRRRSQRGAVHRRAGDVEEGWDSRWVE